VDVSLWLVLTFTVMLCLWCGVFTMVGHIWGSVDDLLATVLLMAFAVCKRFRLALGMVCWVLVWSGGFSNKRVAEVW
jgi:hypothetical protein